MNLILMRVGINTKQNETMKTECEKERILKPNLKLS